MTIDPEVLLASLAACAAIVTALISLVRWVDQQDKARYEQVRREIRNEVRAEIYSRLLELNVSWLSSNPKQRETLEHLSASLSDDMNASDKLD